MSKSRFTIKSIVLGAFVVACASQAHAQIRAFVSGTGNDANPCTVTSPCRNFQRGHDAVAAGGEVVALDSAGYGPLSITKGVTISGEGFRAAVTATGAGTNGITINAANATVILREITVIGLNTAEDGILVTAAANVYIERCVITDFDGDGIKYSTNGRLFVTDTVSRDNGSSGIEVNATGGTAKVNIDHSRFERNSSDGVDLDSGTIEASITNTLSSENDQEGFDIDAASRVNITHSTAANNGGNGFDVSDATAQLNIEYSFARGNLLSGMRGANSATIRVSNSVSTNNGIGFENDGGTFESRINNTVAGNTTPSVGTINTLIAQ